MEALVGLGYQQYPLMSLIGLLILPGSARGDCVCVQMFVETTERARRDPLFITSFMEAMSADQGLDRAHWLQTNGALFERIQFDRFDDQALPCGLIAWTELLIEVVLGDLLPFRSIPLTRALDAVEPVFASQESNSDGDNIVVSTALWTYKGGIG